mmetsp:Transcript_10976/g.42750  ORF Transcript_10976/g.42750 Transcript_10976/m.42750 type:complete len:750 (+) Transcript_10976:459-2708(+)
MNRAGDVRPREERTLLLAVLLAHPPRRLRVPRPHDGLFGLPVAVHRPLVGAHPVMPILVRVRMAVAVAVRFVVLVVRMRHRAVRVGVHVPDRRGGIILVVRVRVRVRVPAPLRQRAPLEPAHHPDDHQRRPHDALPPLRDDLHVERQLVPEQHEDEAEEDLARVVAQAPQRAHHGVLHPRRPDGEGSERREVVGPRQRVKTSRQEARVAALDRHGRSHERRGGHRARRPRRHPRSHRGIQPRAPRATRQKHRETRRRRRPPKRLPAKGAEQSHAVDGDEKRRALVQQHGEPQGKRPDQRRKGRAHDGRARERDVLAKHRLGPRRQVEELGELRDAVRVGVKQEDVRGGGGGFGIAAREDGRLAASHPPARPRLHERRRRGRRRRDEAGQRQREPRERRLRRGLPARAVARLAQVVISLPDALEPDARDGLDPARVALDPRVHARVRRFIARLLPRVGLVRRHSRRVAVAGRSVDSCDARVDSCGAFPLHLRGEPAHGLDVRGDDVHRVDVRRARAGKVARCARASRSSRGGGIAGGHSCAGGRGSGGRSGARGSFDAPDRRRASVGSHRQLERDVTALSQGREIVRRGRRAVAVSAEHGVDHLRDLRGARGALGDANLAHVHQVGRHPVRVPVRVPRADADALGGALRRGGRVRRALHEQDRVSVGEARAGDALIVLEHAAAVDEALRRGGHAADGLDHAFQREDVDIAGDGQRVLSRGFLLPDLDRDLGSRRASIRTLHRGRLGSSAL